MIVSAIERGTAIHEAAHALAHHLLRADRARVVRVSVRYIWHADHLSAGEVCTESTSRPKVVSEGTALQWAEEDIAACMAGGVAQRLLGGLTPRELRYAMTGDWRAIRGCVSQLERQGLPIGLGMLLRARRKVDRLLRENRALIEALATALIERETLAADEVIAFLQDAAT